MTDPLPKPAVYPTSSLLTDDFRSVTMSNQMSDESADKIVDRKEYIRQWREANPDKVRAAKQRWRNANPGRERELGRSASRRYRINHQRQPGTCSICGGKTADPRTVRCVGCWRELQHNLAKIKTTADHRAYMREYMAKWREIPPQVKAERQRLRELRALQRRQAKPCRFRACQFYGLEHKHCECGWEIRLTENFCHICLAEQSRLEFKTWAA